MLNMLNLFFNKESSSEDRSDSGFETCTISQGDYGLFLEFSIKFYAGHGHFLSFGRTLNVTPLLAPPITSC